MQPAILGILVSAAITCIGLIIGYIQWRRDVQIKLGQIREAVSIELIQQRVEPYTEFLKKLEISSSVHQASLSKNRKRLDEFFGVLQEALYGKVGLLASHETRLLLLYLRSGCREVMEGTTDFSELRLRLWAVHVALRSDLGITQPRWSNVIEKVHADASNKEQQIVDDLVRAYPWDSVYANIKEIKENLTTK